MIFEAMEPLHITTKSLGEVSLSPGDRLDWPDQAVKLLLTKYPESVRVVDHDLPFQPGDRVDYRTPQPDSRNFRPEWVAHSGIVLQVDPDYEMVLIQPKDEAGKGTRWVWWGYAKKANDGEA